MTFSYTLATDIGKVRLNIGDTVSTGAKLTDEEIQIALDAHVGVIPSSIRCVEWIIAQLAKTPDRSVVGISSTSALEQYKSLLKELRARDAISGEVAAYSGNISQDRIDEAEDDTDYPAPAFSVGRDDNPPRDASEAADD